MGWVSEDGHKYNKLTETDITSISSFSIGCYYFKFSKMSPFDRTSLMYKFQSHHDNNEFNPYDFVDYLLVRKIKFLLLFRPISGASFKINMRHLKVIARLNFRILLGAGR